MPKESAKEIPKGLPKDFLNKLSKNFQKEEFTMQNPNYWTTEFFPKVNVK